RDRLPPAPDRGRGPRGAADAARVPAADRVRPASEPRALSRPAPRARLARPVRGRGRPGEALRRLPAAQARAREPRAGPDRDRARLRLPLPANLAGLRGRQLDEERRPPALLAADADAAAVGLDDCLRDVEPEARAGDVAVEHRLGAEEALEQVRAVGLGDP